MGDIHHRHQTTTSSRFGLRNTGGEIVEVQGGHIVRSTGRKDRHSKVCTAKGPRDRRVRLSAHTAIQFYDVQDRLGYDRPSKAVDWLIKNAKSAIDELAELPAWNPSIPCREQDLPQNQQQQFGLHHSNVVVGNVTGSSSKRSMALLRNDGENQEQVQMGSHSRNHGDNNSSFLPPSLDSDAIADTIKSFFPMGASAEANSSSIQFPNFPPVPDLLSRTSSQSQDLRLSLQSFQDPMLLQHHNQQTEDQNPTNQAEQVIFAGTGFDVSAWPENQPSEICRFQKIMAWNGGGDSTTCGGGFMFNSPPTPPLLQPLFGGQNQFFSQRGPLQSSDTPSIRAWSDPSAINVAGTDHHRQHQRQHHQTLPINPSPISGIDFASAVGGFTGFRIPARIQGEEEEHDGISDKPSSASSDSRH